MRESKYKRFVLTHFESDSAEPVAVTLIEGTLTSGTFFVTPLLVGQNHCILEIHVKRGVFSKMHLHAHESFVCVVSGKLKTVVGEQVLELGRGDACRYPQNVMHSVEALEDTVFLETKAPVPDLQAVFSA